MARNVEIKARVADICDLQMRAGALAESAPESIAQDDTFFACARGRLKLRVFAAGSGELIAYDRPDDAGPKTSDYRITPVAEPDSLRATLASALGATGRVVKRRLLYRIGRTRVHLDSVEGLGDFIELEVVLRDGESAQEGVAEAHALMQQLGVESGQLIAGAYVDLLAAQTAADASTTR